MSFTAKEVVDPGPRPALPFSTAVRAGGLVYVSGIVASDERGELVPGDVTAQTRHVLDRLSRILEAAGSTMANAVALTVYLEDAADFGALNATYRGYWPEAPPTRTTVVSGLMLPGARVEISAVAVPTGGEREVVHPATWLQSPSPYSYGIRSGDTLFLSGMVPRNMADNSSVGGDVAVQTRVVLDQIGEVLATGGMSHADIVSSRVYIADAATAPAMNDVYRTFFPRDPPARATVQAELMSAAFNVEITAVAVAGTDRHAITTPSPDGSPGRRNPNLSSAVRVGRRLFVSGMLGHDDSNRDDVGAQTVATLGRIDRTLQAAGLAREDVVDSLVYLTAVGGFPAMNAAYREYFPTAPPARATVGNPLLNPQGLVEIMCMAVR